MARFCSCTVSSRPSSGMDQVVDERKRRRMESNRESAKRSRMRKEKHLQDLLDEANKLRSENGKMAAMVNYTAAQCAKMEAQNKVLESHRRQLAEWYEVLVAVDVNSVVPEWPPLLKTWPRLPCPAQIRNNVASSTRSMLRC